MKLNALVIDSNKESYILFKTGFTIFFSDDDIYVDVDYSNSCEDALLHKNLHMYDVILVDYSYNDHVIREIVSKSSSGAKVQVMSYIRDFHFIKNILKTGAIGVLFKPFSFEDILKNAYSSLFTNFKQNKLEGVS